VLPLAISEDFFIPSSCAVSNVILFLDPTLTPETSCAWRAQEGDAARIQDSAYLVHDKQLRGHEERHEDTREEAHHEDDL
jgi:hypothetical protein